MNNPLSADGRIKTPSMVQLGYRVLSALTCVSLGVVSLWLWLSWHSVKQQQLQRMGTVATMVAGQAENYFDVLGSRLETLADGLRELDVLHRPQAALPVLQHFKAEYHDPVDITVTRQDGEILASTALTPNTVLSDASGKRHAHAGFENDRKAHGFSVHRPQFSHALDAWVMPLRYTERDTAGRVLFFIQTGITLDKQQALWRHLKLDMIVPGASIGLLREDGYLISRFPMPDPHRLYGGRQVKGALFLATRNRALAGRYEGLTADGMMRLGAYWRLRHYPVYAFMSVPTYAVWGMWWQYVRFPLYLLAGLMLIGSWIYIALARRFTRRMESIRARLSEVSDDHRDLLPSSGVREIDVLCSALADTRAKLNLAAKNRERLLLAAAEAGTYAVRASDGVIIAADSAFLAMVGLDEHDVVGRPWTALPAETSERDDPHQDREIVPRVLCLKRRDGQPVWLRLAEYLDQSAGETVRHGLAINVSHREKLLFAVNTQSVRLQTLWQLATDRSMPDMEKVGLMLRLGLEIFAMETAMIGEIVGDQYVIRHVVDTLGGFTAGQHMPLNDTLCQFVIQEKKNLFIANLLTNERFRHYPSVAELGARAYISAAIQVGERVYGTLVFLRRRPYAKAFSHDDKAFIELLASWFGQVLLEQQRRQELEHLAMTDSLTHLPNRRAAEIRFDEEIARARRQGETFSIALCDLDNFKLVNDYYGHATGDQVLQHVAAQIRGLLRGGDWMARWGGEEFVVFLPRAGADQAAATAERIRQTVKAQPVKIHQAAIDLTVSIGIGLFSGAEDDISQVLAKADECLYEAKKSGRDRIVVDQSERRNALWRASLLQHALQEHRIVPAYQVMIDLATHDVVADEALARLMMSDGAALPATEFVDMAEGINLIHQVDSIISRQAMQRCSEKLRARTLGADFSHFINLSPQFLAHKDLVQQLLDDARHYCKECGVDLSANRLKPIVFEITERHLLTDFDGLRRKLQPLLDFGFRLALDDFGSGYSSFLYLAELPVSFIKIEGWMARNVRRNKNVRHIVQSLITLADQLGIITIAEGIEDRETAETLRAMGVKWGQGYYFGEPQLEPEPLPRLAVQK